MTAPFSINTIGLIILFSAFLLACSSKKTGEKDEQLRVSATDTVSVDTTAGNSIHGNLTLSQLNTTPHKVILTGLPQHRLITVYKIQPPKKPKEIDRFSSYSESYYHDYEAKDYQTHFMPGIDLQFGYNLVNIAHYDLLTEKMNYLFDQPVLIKSLYYPSFEQDSLHKKPINRDYYLVSVYDADTNADTLVNRRDLRRIYHFNASANVKTQLIPSDYSVQHSQYDSQNDVMYIYARKDANKNGMADKDEPVHVFWISLKTPGPAKRMY